MVYCSLACQKKDWKTHKVLCQNLTGFRENDRPSSDSYRCIYFPDNEEKPRFIWLKVSGSEVTDAASDFIEALFPLPHDFSVAHQPIFDTPIFEKEMNHDLWITHRADYLMDVSVPNQSIMSVLGPELGTFFRGPMVVSCCIEKGEDGIAVDASMADYRYALDHFLQRKKSSDIKQHHGVPPWFADLMTWER